MVCCTIRFYLRCPLSLHSCAGPATRLLSLTPLLQVMCPNSRAAQDTSKSVRHRPAMVGHLKISHVPRPFYVPVGYTFYFTTLITTGCSIVDCLHANCKVEIVIYDISRRCPSIANARIDYAGTGSINSHLEPLMCHNGPWFLFALNLPTSCTYLSRSCIVICYIFHHDAFHQ